MPICTFFAFPKSGAVTNLCTGFINRKRIKSSYFASITYEKIFSFSEILCICLEILVFNIKKLNTYVETKQKNKINNKILLVI